MHDRNRICRVLVFVLLSSVIFFQAPSGSSQDRSQIRKVEIPRSEEFLLMGEPGEIYQLPDSETHIRFDSQQAPYIYFGEKMILNDPDNVNYLTLGGELTIQSKGHIYTLSFLDCEMEIRHTDTAETWITSCRILIESERAAERADSFDRFRKGYALGDRKRAFHRTGRYPAAEAIMRELSLNQEPFLKAFAGPVRMYHYHFNDPPSTAFDGSSNLPIQLVSAYGSKKIFLKEEDVWEKRSKKVSLGAFDITIKASDYDCRQTYIEDRDGYTSICTNVTLLFDIAPRPDAIDPAHGVRILNYTRCDSEASLRRRFPKKERFSESERCA